MIVGFLGRKSSGKDTSADYLVKKYNFEKKAFAGNLKEACRILFGFTDEQLHGSLKEVPDPRWFNVTPRQVMQFVGSELLREKLQELIPQLEFDFHLLSLKNSINIDKNLVISDVRFQNEVDFVHQQGGVVIKLIRPQSTDLAQLKEESSVDSHQSENIDNITYDHLVMNDGSVEDLHQKINEIINDL